MNSLEWIIARGRSFRYAGSGIRSFFKTEPNAAVHLAATIVVACLALYFRLSKTESMAIVFSIAMVWVTEMLNTAIEKTADFITLERHPHIKIIKDISAGAALVAAMAAAIAGCLIFIPKIF